MAKTTNIKFGSGNTEKDGVNAHAAVPKDLKVIGYDKKGKPIYGEKDPEGLYSGGRKV